MAMKTRVVTPPAEEPVSLEEIKAQLALTLDLDDEILARKGRAARQYVERFIGGPLIATTFEGALDRFPLAEIEIPVTPVLDDVQISYVDPQGVLRILPPTNYEVDQFGEPGWIVPHAGFSWPATMATVNAVRVEWTAGFGATPAHVPEALREAILQLAAWWYEQREPAAEAAMRDVPYGVDDILRQHRGWSFG